MVHAVPCHFWTSLCGRTSRVFSKGSHSLQNLLEYRREQLCLFEISRNYHEYFLRAVLLLMVMFCLLALNLLFLGDTNRMIAEVRRFEDLQFVSLEM